MARKISKERTAEFMMAAMQELQHRGGSARFGEISVAIAPRLGLSDYELEISPQHNLSRWQKVLHFYSIDLVKAGWIIKQDRQWHITPVGQEKLALSPLDFYEQVTAEYRKWKAANRQPIGGATGEEDEEEIDESPVGLEQAQEQSFLEIAEHIRQLDPYTFQDLVAELLKGMGYYVRLVAARGRDGGIDIVAYQDALGFASPRMKVQVKHRNSTMDVKEVREFNSLLRKEGDVGLIVSTGGFTSSALDEIRHSNYHIETMDLNRLIDLWQEHYSTIPQTGKALLPLQPVYFLALEI